MSDFNCGRCGGGIEFRLLPDGEISTLCESCDSSLYNLSAPDREEYYDLIYEGDPTEREFLFNPFICPNCDVKVKKVSRKTRKCPECEFNYPIYD